MNSDDVRSLGSLPVQGKRQKPRRQRGYFCTVCNKPISGKGTRNRWLRFIIDVRTMGFFGTKTVVPIYVGGYCCRDHMLQDLMKVFENIPNVEP